MSEFLIALPVYVIVFFLGASVGSFLNVIIYRIPEGLSILYPPSRCPHCLHRLQPYDNVPIFGWFWLKGRCRYCHAPISARYPLIETLTGCLFLLTLLTGGLTGHTVGMWLFLAWLLALAMIDLDTMILPNSLTQSGLILGLGFQGIQGGNLEGLMSGILGAVVGIWLLEIIAFLGSVILGQSAMGGGDPKLMAMIGAWLGWKYLLVAGFLACFLGTLVGGGGIALGVINRRQPVPFGPFLALGAGITSLWGEMILSTYFGLFFPGFHS